MSAPTPLTIADHVSRFPDIPSFVESRGGGFAGFGIAYGVYVGDHFHPVPTHPTPASWTHALMTAIPHDASCNVPLGPLRQAHGVVGGLDARFVGTLWAQDPQGRSR